MIAFRDARPDDAAPLAAMARASFVATFGDLYHPEDLAAFLEQAFGPGGLPADLHDRSLRVRIALDGERIVGFAKLARHGSLPPPARPEDAELKQLYVLGPWQGAGVAPMLMAWAIDRARAAGATRLVLSVFVDNHRAKRFYARHGFAEVGAVPFRVGDHVDDDRLWSLDL